jgi:glycosyltransferase involved in cell wall biosynthesis
VAAPPISVAIPVHNAAPYVAAAIESVLAQTVPVAEVLVVDDGSTDDSGAVARRFGGTVRCVRQDNAGQGSARNRAVALARGELLAFLDADDLWPRDKLERQLAALRRDRDLEAVFGHVEQFVSPELVGPGQPVIPAARRVLAGPVAGTLLIRRAAFDRVGPFDARWRIAALLDWLLRAEDVGLRYVTLPDVLLLRRRHRDNMGLQERAGRIEYAQVLRLAVARRRGGAASARP